MPRSGYQLRVRDPQILLLLPLLARAHRHAPILRTNPVDTPELSAYESRLTPRADKKRSSATNRVRKMVAVRTFADWEEPLRPGFMEMDLVTHCGPRAEGSFVHSLVLTDVASGWTECVALPV